MFDRKWHKKKSPERREKATLENAEKKLEAKKPLLGSVENQFRHFRKGGISAITVFDFFPPIVFLFPFRSAVFFSTRADRALDLIKGFTDKNIGGSKAPFDQ